MQRVRLAPPGPPVRAARSGTPGCSGVPEPLLGARPPAAPRPPATAARTSPGRARPDPRRARPSPRGRRRPSLAPSWYTRNSRPPLQLSREHCAAAPRAHAPPTPAARTPAPRTPARGSSARSTRRVPCRPGRARCASSARPGAASAPSRASAEPPPRSSRVAGEIGQRHAALEHAPRRARTFPCGSPRRPSLRGDPPPFRAPRSSSCRAPDEVLPLLALAVGVLRRRGRPPPASVISRPSQSTRRVALSAHFHARGEILLRLGEEVAAAARCRRASSRSAAPARSRPRCSGGTRRPAGRGSPPVTIRSSVWSAPATQRPVPGPPPRPEEEREVHGVGELRRAPEAALDRIQRPRQRPSAQRSRPRPRPASTSAPSPSVASCRSPSLNSPACASTWLRCLGPGRDSASSSIRNDGQPVTRLGREVRAAEERHAGPAVRNTVSGQPPCPPSAAPRPGRSGPGPAAPRGPPSCSRSARSSAAPSPGPRRTRAP